MAFNLTNLSKVLRGNTQKSGDTIKATKTLDQAKPSVSFAKILKGENQMIDRSVAAFAGNSARSTRLRGFQPW